MPEPGGDNICSNFRLPLTAGGRPSACGGYMPEWWLEAVLPGVVFSLLLVVWVAIPPRDGESDLGSRLRRMIRGR